MTLTPRYLSGIMDELGIQKLDTFSSDDLQRHIQSSVGIKLRRSDIAVLYSQLLHEHLMQDMSGQGITLILEWVKALRCLRFDNNSIYVTFKRQKEHASGMDPLNHRRYMMAEKQLEQLMNPQLVEQSHHKKDKTQQLGETRPRSRSPHITGANTAPLGGREPRQEIQQSRSEGDNAMQRRSGHTRPPRNYTCNRCKQPGHLIGNCPTNLDPGFDMAPDPNYKCTICGQTGVHYGTLCPKNTNVSSLTQQRRRAGILVKSKLHQRRSHSPGRDHAVHRGSKTDYSQASSRSFGSVPALGRRGPISHGMNDEYSPLSSPSSREWSVEPSMRVQSPSGGPSYHRSWKEMKRHGDSYRSSTTTDVEQSCLPEAEGAVHTDLASRSMVRRRSDDSEIAADKRSWQLQLDNSEETLLRHTNYNARHDMECGSLSDREHNTEAQTRARIEATDFLQSLQPRLSVGAEEPERTNADVLDGMVRKVSRDDSYNMGESTMSPGANGEHYRLVSSPAFCDVVVHLFRDHPNPIINRRGARKTAAQMIDELDVP